MVFRRERCVCRSLGCPRSCRVKAVEKRRRVNRGSKRSDSTTTRLVLPPTRSRTSSARLACGSRSIYKATNLATTNMEAPLSPSRRGNALPVAPTPRKRMVFEEDDSFFAAAALAEAEEDEVDEEPHQPQEQPPSSSSPVKERVPVASTSAQRFPQIPKTTPAPFERKDTEVISRPGVKEGKRRIVLETEEGFGDGMDFEGAHRCAVVDLEARAYPFALTQKTCLHSAPLPQPCAPPFPPATSRRASTTSPGST